MPDTIEWIALLGAGLAGGALAGLLGIGGGVIYVFVLTLFLDPLVASDTDLVRFVVANSLLATFFAGISSSWSNYKNGNLPSKAIAFTALPGAIAALGVAWLLVHYDWYGSRIYSVFIILLLGYMAYRMLYLRPRRHPGTPHPRESNENFKESHSSSVTPRAAPLFLAGTTAGLVSALSGLGGGVVLVPFLSEVCGIPVRKASEISLGVIPVFALSMTLFYALTRHEPEPIPFFHLGYILPQYVLPMAAGVWIGAQQGTRWAHRLSDRIISLLFGLMLITVALRMLWNLFS